VTKNERGIKAGYPKESLSIKQAKKLVLLSQRIPPITPKVDAAEATLAVIEHLGYVQIDTISVIQRAHHHTIWNRNPRYLNSHIDQLMTNKQIFEYWSHAAAYLPMRDYRYSLIRKNAIKRGAQKHWHEVDHQLMDQVMRRIEKDGPLMAKDFEHTGKKTEDWRSKPAKQALENLYIRGDIMVSYRQSFHKVYELTERVIPNNLDTSAPSMEEYARFLIRQYLKANGIGLASEMTYLLKKTKPIVNATLKQMLAEREIMEVKLGDQNYFILESSLELLNKPLNHHQLKILSPFDNLIIQRKRTQAIFGFNYLLECYLPEKKRQYGYFSLPILWDGNLVARMDCKADRQASKLYIHHLFLEKGIEKKEEFAQALSKELNEFMKFNACDSILLNRTNPSAFKSILLNRLMNKV
jgi:uncharacterized protein YcaQ